jgi:hypothetical protein
MMASNMTRVVGATSRNFASDPALGATRTRPVPGDGFVAIIAAARGSWLFSLQASLFEPDVF